LQQLVVNNNNWGSVLIDKFQPKTTILITYASKAYPTRADTQTWQALCFDFNTISKC